MGLALRARGRALLFLSTLTLVLAAPSAAHAARTGSLLFGDSSPITCAENTECILSQGDLGGDPSNNVVSEDGTITDFTFRHVTGDVALVVLRQTGSSFSVVDRTNYVTGSGDDEEESYNVTGVSVRAGDFIGLALAPGASVGARDATGETGTNVLEFTDANPPVLVADDQAAELFLQATYEPNDTSPPPDDSGFDFGGGGDDSSAEPDPLAALKAGARPKVTISGKAVRASKKYSIRITVRNPNGYGVKGKLSLKSKGLKVGSKSFAVAPESTASVRVKLSRKARSRLARRRTLKATVRASYKGPIGKAGSSTKRITLKAPKRPKPRRRTPSGGGGGGGGGGGLFRPPLCVPHIEYDANGWAHAVPC